MSPSNLWWGLSTTFTFMFLASLLCRTLCRISSCARSCPRLPTQPLPRPFHHLTYKYRGLIQAYSFYFYFLYTSLTHCLVQYFPFIDIQLTSASDQWQDSHETHRDSNAINSILIQFCNIFCIYCFTQFTWTSLFMCNMLMYGSINHDRWCNMSHCFWCILLCNIS